MLDRIKNCYSTTRQQLSTFAEAHPERVTAMMDLAALAFLLGISISLAIRAAIHASGSAVHLW